MSASTWARTTEIDAFGPWILRVRTPEDVPALFRPVLDLAGARTAVKIPRPIERRDARPGMDLYDRLLVVRDDGVEVLSRVPEAPGGRERRWLPADDVLAIEDSTELLDGMLRLHAAGTEPVEIPYNGASADVVLTLLDEIRFYWRPPAGFPERLPELRLDALGLDDVGLVSHHRDLARHDPMLRPLVLRRRLTAHRAGNPFVRAVAGTWPPTLHAAVVETTGSELVVLHRRSWLDRGRHGVHSLATTVVPLSRGVHVEVSDDPRWTGIRRLRLAPTDITLLAVSGDGIEDAVRAVLRDR
jgi:hypothetical protein